MMFSIEASLFYLFTSLAIFSSIMVIGSPNPIHSVLFLILVFFNATALLIFLEVEFLAMIFLVIYVGAIAVLFLFVVMMLNINLAELSENLLRYLPIGGIIGIIFLIEIFSVLGSDLISLTSHPANTKISSVIIQPVDWITQIIQLNNIEIFGLVIYTHFFYLFIIASLILLVAMIGAIVLTVHQTRDLKRQNIVDQLSREAKETILHWSNTPEGPKTRKA